MRNLIIWTEVDEPKTYDELQGHIDETNSHMTQFEFISHQLIYMFAMRLTQILMKYDTVAKWSKHHPRHRPIEISEKTHLLFSLSVILS